MIRKRNRDDSSDPSMEIGHNGDITFEQRNITSNIKGDEKNILILFFLYLLQGIPLGLAQAIPIILTNSGLNYKQQALFSLVHWPFSVKLLWAPIVDSVYSTKVGKRKSWLIPVQYLIGMVMLVLSYNVDTLLKGGDKGPNLLMLFLAFLSLNFLSATQDIAVDGWALTMLKRENVAYASTCNSVGQTAGYLFGYVAFIALESASFSNTFLRKEPLPHGVCTLSGFLQFWGIVFLVTTTLVFLFKSENRANEEESMSVMETYWNLTKIATLRPIILLTAVLLTGKVAFSAVDAVTGLKLIEMGVPKERLALMGIPLVPLQILLPLLLSKKTSGPHPMNIYLKAYPYRILFGLLIMIFVYVTPWFIRQGIPLYYYVMLFLLYSAYQVTLYSMFVAQMAFFAKISDPRVGGTYMTFVNTLANIGTTWPTTVALWFVEGLTWAVCSNNPANLCSNDLKEECVKNGGVCEIQIDGYYIEVLICSVIGFLWMLWGRGAIKKLQSSRARDFAIRNSIYNL